jgi:hypothetical protein
MEEPASGHTENRPQQATTMQRLDLISNTKRIHSLTLMIRKSFEIYEIYLLFISLEKKRVSVSTIFDRLRHEHGVVFFFWFFFCPSEVKK